LTYEPEARREGYIKNETNDEYAHAKKNRRESDNPATMIRFIAKQKYQKKLHGNT
jgi:hypothetical protein